MVTTKTSGLGRAALLAVPLMILVTVTVAWRRHRSAPATTAVDQPAAAPDAAPTREHRRWPARPQRPRRPPPGKGAGGQTRTGGPGWWRRAPPTSAARAALKR